MSIRQKFEAYPPNATKKLVACLSCKLINTQEQFLQNGTCPNCEEPSILDYEALKEFTTTNFVGMISLVQPKSSWVGRWNGLKGSKPGVYAIDAKQEVVLVGRRSKYATLDEYESDTSLGQRDEREVVTKREYMHL